MRNCVRISAPKDDFPLFLFGRQEANIAASLAENGKQVRFLKGGVFPKGGAVERLVGKDLTGTEQAVRVRAAVDNALANGSLSAALAAGRKQDCRAI